MASPTPGLVSVRCHCCESPHVRFGSVLMVDGHVRARAFCAPCNAGQPETFFLTEAALHGIL